MRPSRIGRFSRIGACGLLFGATDGSNAARLTNADATRAATLAANDIALVSVAIMAQPGAAPALTVRIHSLGGAVAFLSPNPGFISAVIPRAALEELPREPGIDAIAVDRLSVEAGASANVAGGPSTAQMEKKDRHLTRERQRSTDWQGKAARDRVDLCTNWAPPSSCGIIRAGTAAG